MTKKYKVEDLPIFDMSECLEDEESIALYLDLVIQEGDPSELIHALGVIAKARGMTEIAKKSGVSREALYRALTSNSAPRFDTVFRVVKALGLEFSLHPQNTQQKESDLQEKVEVHV